MLKSLNKGISTSLAITIIVVLIIALIGGIIFWYHWWPSEDLKKEKSPEGTNELNIIGVYNHWWTSMCAQSCENINLGYYQLTAPLAGFESWANEIAWVTGDFVEVEELPTIAGPEANWEHASEKIKVTKIQIKDYKKINFPKISVSKEELSNYLANKDAKFNLEFENPLDRELKIKVRIADIGVKYNDFQYITLKPLEKKKIQYIYKADSELDYIRGQDDSFELIVIDDFVDDENFKSYYYKKATDLDKDTIIYVEKFVRLEDLIR